MNTDTTTPATLSKREELEQKLKNHFFIVGGGAWQKLWEPKSTRSMGFGSATSDDDAEQYDSPDYTTLKSSIQPELLRRFSSDVLIMHPLTESDYLKLSPEFAKSMTSQQQILFKELVKKHINQAVKNQIGMRFFENICRETLVKDKQYKKLIRSCVESKFHGSC